MPACALYKLKSSEFLPEPVGEDTSIYRGGNKGLCPPFLDVSLGSLHGVLQIVFASVVTG